jgi:pyruvate/2-oxoglutarate dehydrogenase complex dihydrolipoamide dehydrogenase (E3) component
MANQKQCDICVLGGGGAGVAAARTAAALGAKVVLVEKRALGGSYFSQIIPALAFCEAAALRGRPLRSRFDAASAPAKIDFPALRAQMISVIKDFARDYAPSTLSALNIEIIRAVGSFSRPTRLEAGGDSIEAKHFVFAAGATPAPVSIPGWELVRPLPLEDILTLDRPPETLIIIGATFLGLALAQAFLRLGTAVTLVDEGSILPDEDAELVMPVLTQLAREGLRLYSNVKIAGVEPAGSATRLFLDGVPGVIEGAQIVFAGKPIPLLEGLGLKNAGVTYGNSGILVDARGRSSNRHIFVVGSAAGGPDSGCAAIPEAERIARYLVVGGEPLTPAARVLATDPEVAIVGMTEAQARKNHRIIRALRAPLGDTARARLAGRPDGHVKIVTNSAGVILGAGAVGPGAREFIGIFALAIGQKLKADDLDMIASAPSFAAAATSAALASKPQLGKARQWRLI